MLSSRLFVVERKTRDNFNRKASLTVTNLNFADTARILGVERCSKATTQSHRPTAEKRLQEAERAASKPSEVYGTLVWCGVTCSSGQPCRSCAHCRPRRSSRCKNIVWELCLCNVFSKGTPLTLLLAQVAPQSMHCAKHQSAILGRTVLFHACACRQLAGYSTQFHEERELRFGRSVRLRGLASALQDFAAAT